MTSSYYDPFGFHNIQEIVDIRLIFEIICMFYFILILSSFQMMRKEETNNNRRKNACEQEPTV